MPSASRRDEPVAASPAPTTSDDLRKTVNRLKRAQGQLAAVIAAVESGADCRTVVTQLAAVSSAIDRAGFTIISTAMKECLSETNTDSARTPLRVEELEKLFLALS
ncbi:MULTISPECIES: metal-sensitive transcriptional regulator [unclassified Cryobacterium]|uniref:metal-sensitive transcriptional regulator n=1 Tax=unclassified Cryobacterium TaxID=2649013 RepID=UPI002AB40039|nr:MULTISPECIES: metal-sensitive transcriptional regulator [unclassified Cryobacterium]MDY7528234.1 metal-sensitive transcriptional regulator [Cryobacterium sp. 10C2]MDY7556021.1 metal-sensitive transcriptional regulator [Cryobacterium sp. 10C3]MEB0002387.1 metal-sensitive transcriptional regulator [Cryobacterium sp. RTC2.1]MEB0289267.1 metal-sensitive transcriptional regulator [Cryobacterium sp. 10C2]